jgi:hypothetical protein
LPHCGDAKMMTHLLAEIRTSREHLKEEIRVSQEHLKKEI